MISGRSEDPASASFYIHLQEKPASIQERQRLLAKNEKLKDIEQQMNEAYEEQEKAQKHLREVERYCERVGLTMYQYEKQCFMADRGFCDYPYPEQHNPERQQEHEIEREPDRSP